MRIAFLKLMRFVVWGATFFLPEQRRLAIQRRMRGKEEFRRLQGCDCAIVSFGKSGRTWLRMLLSRFYQIRHGLPESCLLSYDNMHRRDASIPKIHLTHDNYLKDYTGHDETKEDYADKKVVLLVRHPGDVAVSQFFQWKFRMRPHKKKINGYPPDGTEMFDFVQGQAAGIPKIIDYLNRWAPHVGRPNVLMVRYEDMKRDAGVELRRILEFVGTPGTDDEIEQAVEFSSFDNMKKMEQKKTFWLAGRRMVPGDRSNPQSYKVRRAKVGGFRDYFDEEQTRALEKTIETTLSPVFGYGSEKARSVS